MDYGTLEYKGKIITLIQQPYLEEVNNCAFYRATAWDDEGNRYDVMWDVLEGWEDMEDESDCCDWDIFEVKEV